MKRVTPAALDDVRGGRNVTIPEGVPLEGWIEPMEGLEPGYGFPEMSRRQSSQEYITFQMVGLDQPTRSSDSQVCNIYEANGGAFRGRLCRAA